MVCSSAFSVLRSVFCVLSFVLSQTVEILLAFVVHWPLRFELYWAKPGLIQQLQCATQQKLNPYSAAWLTKSSMLKTAGSNAPRDLRD